MAVMPWIDVARHAFDAGFRGENHATIVAVAQPESGRRPDAVNDRNANGTIDRGLWQINSVHLQPGGILGTWHPDELFDPAENAVAAWLIFQAQGFGAWAAYNSKLHIPYLGEARVALDARLRLAVNATRIRALESQLATSEAARIVAVTKLENGRVAAANLVEVLA